MRAGFIGFIIGIIFTVLAALGAGYMALTNGVIAANADATPSAIERWIAGTSLRATLRRQAPQGPNPVALNDANLIAGINLYGTHCAVCHGTQSGDQSAPPVATGENPKPPLLASHGVEDDPEGWTFWKIKHGIRWTGMPAWEHQLSDQQIWTLALFLKHMDKLPPGPQAAWQAVRSGETAESLGHQTGPAPGANAPNGSPINNTAATGGSSQTSAPATTQEQNPASNAAANGGGSTQQTSQPTGSAANPPTPKDVKNRNGYRGLYGYHGRSRCRLVHRPGVGHLVRVCR